MDFTFSVYKHLLVAVQPCGYSFQTFADFIQSPKKKTIILRHDVDRLPDNALQMARLEHEAGIAATYYFRAVPESWDESIIREIASLGHEVGYHYENLSEISNGERGKRIEKLVISKENRGNRNEERGLPLESKDE